MFNDFKSPPVDAILALSIAFRQDERADKIDLGIGVYKDARGATPVMRAIKEAERRVWDVEDSKAYLGLGGDEAFAGHIQDMVLGNVVDRSRLRSIQAVGGGAAVRLLCDLLAEGRPGAIWVPNPTWINHVPIAKAAGLSVREYSYLDHTSSTVAFDRMLAELSCAKAGDVVLLHGCCHNPTGADLTQDQWLLVTDLLVRNRLLPFIDIAYQGFGDGLEADVQGVRLLAAKVPELVMSTSCSKNFGVYRDRVGTAVILAEDTRGADRAKAVLLSKGRVNYSFPANHGAATVAAVFKDPALFADWRQELEGMRLRMVATRQALADELRRATNSSRFDFIRNHKGMFSLIGLDGTAIGRLREEHAIFMPPDGRLNIAAVKETDVDLISKAISTVL